MARIRVLMLLALSFTTLRCASAPASTAPLSAASAERGAILRADEEFARAAQEKGLAEAFAAYAAEDATILPNGGNPVTGREAIRGLFASSSGTVLTWRPFAAEVSRSGDLGYTLGTYESRSTDAAGKAVIRYGKYCTIWKKQPDGTWRYVVDLGNPSPAPAGTRP